MSVTATATRCYWAGEDGIAPFGGFPRGPFLGFHPWIQQFLLSSFHPRPMYMAGRSMQKACRRADAGVERAEISEFQGLSGVYFLARVLSSCWGHQRPPCKRSQTSTDKEEADGTQACFQARPSQGTPGLSRRFLLAPPGGCLAKWRSRFSIHGCFPTGLAARLELRAGDGSHLGNEGVCLVCTVTPDVALYCTEPESREGCIGARSMANSLRYPGAPAVYACVDKTV